MLNHAFCLVLLFGYSLVKKTGILATRRGRSWLLVTYYLYKRWCEDPFSPLLRSYPHLVGTGHILDIGAGIGYTAAIFARAVSPGFKVHAFEPEPSNYALLLENIAQEAVSDRVSVVKSAVGASTGTTTLLKSQRALGDHRIATAQESAPNSEHSNNVIEVPLTSIDTYLTAHGITGPIGFIKIDVQGFELQVCCGMEHTLAKNPQTPVVFEYAHYQLDELGVDGNDLLQFFIQRGYSLFRVHKNGSLAALDLENLRHKSYPAYFNILATRQPNFTAAREGVER